MVVLQMRRCIHGAHPSADVGRSAALVIGAGLAGCATSAITGLRGRAALRGAAMCAGGAGAAALAAADVR